MGDSINQDVLVGARGKVGQQIGRGECWDLADRALRQARARTSITTGKGDHYVWGDPVDLKDVQPGDVLQFRDFDVTTTIDRTVTFEGGNKVQRHTITTQSSATPATTTSKLMRDANGKMKLAKVIERSPSR